MKILITGAYGMLGSDLRETLKNFELICTGSKDLDITDEEKVMDFITEKSPDLVINAAAYTAVDDCETNYDEAYAVNAIGPRNLAIACKRQDIPLIHISTDYVFDGSKRTPLMENDKLGPQSAYGKTKLAGEEFLDLAVAITNLLQSDKYGIYHVTNEGECSWYDFAKAIFEFSNIDVNVIPVSTEEFPRPAPRPHYSVLDNKKWNASGFVPMRDYKEALGSFLSLYNFFKRIGKI